MFWFFNRLASLLLVGLVIVSQISPGSAEGKVHIPDEIASSANRAWRGDFDGMIKRRKVRILVPYSKTLFFIDRGRQLGVVAEFGQAFEAWLNKRYARGHLRLHVAFVPTPRDELLTALRYGLGDIVAANLTITP